MISSNDSITMTVNDNYNEYYLQQSGDSSPTYSSLDGYYPSYSDALAYSGSSEIYYNNQSYQSNTMLSESPQSYQQLSEPNFRQTFYDPFDVKHRKRTSHDQFKVLEKTFRDTPKPNAMIRRRLAQELTMTPRGVQVWFQNRRAKEKSLRKTKTEKRNVDNKLNECSLDVVFKTEEVPHAHNAYACQEYHQFATPMSRTMSYPFISDASTNADEEDLLLRTPATPMIEGIHKSADWDFPMNSNFFFDTSYPIFMNHQNNRKPVSPIIRRKDCTLVNRLLMQEEITQSPSHMQRYYGNSLTYNDYRRQSYPNNNMNRYFPSTELCRRLSDSIYDPNATFYPY
ncbi:homeobox domain-containing protein [Pilobolus umbonatus]|nr:homeobox domain-containing protein [Pilobolus umbonatus]